MSLVPKPRGKTDPYTVSLLWLLFPVLSYGTCYPRIDLCCETVKLTNLFAKDLFADPSSFSTTSAQLTPYVSNWQRVSRVVCFPITLHHGLDVFSECGSMT